MGKVCVDKGANSARKNYSDKGVGGIGGNKMHKAMITSLSPSYRTPKKLYDALNNEFNFNDDPCPLSDNGIDGLLRSWGTRTFMNPPYGKHIGKWMMKAYAESQLDKIVVCLVPARTDTKWWHEWVTRANDVRFIKGRLTFEGQKNPAPFPSVIVIFGENRGIGGNGKENGNGIIKAGY